MNSKNSRFIETKAQSKLENVRKYFGGPPTILVTLTLLITALLSCLEYVGVVLPHYAPVRMVSTLIILQFVMIGIGSRNQFPQKVGTLVVILGIIAVSIGLIIASNYELGRGSVLIIPDSDLDFQRVSCKLTGITSGLLLVVLLICFALLRRSSS